MTTPREIVERLREIAGQQKLYSDLVLKSGNEFHAETLSAYAKLDYEAASTIERLVEALQTATVGFACVMEAAEHEGTDECHEIARLAKLNVARALTGGE